MNDPQSTPDHGRTDDRSESAVRRRAVIAAGGTAGATLFAGCLSEQSPADEDEDEDENEGEGESEEGAEEQDEETADRDGSNFRLLISDLPADIGDFDSLNVSFDSARIFDGGEESDMDGADEEADDEPADSNAASGDGVDRRRGFYILDLDDATVDLTQVVGDKAIGVFEGELSEGQYNKIELYVSAIEGIVDGDEAEVRVPSEKLQLTSSFEIRADEPVEFVFDINVVKRGPNNGYNLQPVISQSGVNGTDVEVEEIDGDETDESGDGGSDDGDEDGSNGEDAT